MGFKIEQSKRWDLLPLAGLSLILWAVYLMTLSPAFPANDSPETISAAWELGIQHPPGYPLHTLLGRLSILGFGLGSPAWRVSCLSASLGVLAALCAALCARFLSNGSRVAMLSAGLCLGLWKTVWEQATEAKGGIYLLNLALGLAMVLLALWAVSPSSAKPLRALRLWGLAAGLSLAGHYMSAVLFILPTACLLIWFLGKRSLKALPWILPGLSLYLVLPLRAQFQPFNNIGDPSTWAGFLWVFLRRGYTQAGLTGQWDIALDQLRLWWIWSWTHGAYVVLPLGIWGGRELWLKRKPAAMMLAAIYALFFVSVVLINRTLTDVRWLSDIFMIPGQGVLAISAGLGLGALFERYAKPAALPAMLCLGLAMAWSQYGRLDRSRDFAAYDFGVDLESSLPKGSVYAADGDYLYMPLLYSQQVQGRRQDIEPLIATLLRLPFYKARMARRHTGPISAISLLHPSLDEKEFSPLSLQPHGLVYQLAPPSAAQAPGLTQAWTQRGDTRQELEPLTSQLLPWYAVAAVNRGNAFEAEGKHKQAAAAYELALGETGFKPESKILFNLGQALERSGDKAGAIAAYERALSKEPGLDIARQRLATLQPQAGSSGQQLLLADQAAAAGDAAKALPLYQKVLASGQQSAAIWRNIGVLQFKNGRLAQADDAFAKAVALSPKDALLYKYRAMVLDKLGDKEKLKSVAEAGLKETGDLDLKALVDKLK